jgi:predicted Zn finger-like uncharacterized protein
MALATRCPHCTTAFRVASDQLKLRAGLVRCGTCKEIFNGIENLLRPDEDIVAATAAPVPPERPIPTVSATLPIPKHERGDNTRFNDLIAEVDHPEDLRRDVAPAPSAPAASPENPDTTAHGYAANYAPIRLTPSPSLPHPAAAVTRWPTVPGIVPRLQPAEQHEPASEGDSSQAAPPDQPDHAEHAEHADQADQAEHDKQAQQAASRERPDQAGHADDSEHVDGPDRSARPEAALHATAAQEPSSEANFMTVLYRFDDAPPNDPPPPSLQNAAPEPDSDALWAALDDPVRAGLPELDATGDTGSLPWPLLPTLRDAHGTAVVDPAPFPEVAAAVDVSTDAEPSTAQLAMPVSDEEADLDEDTHPDTKKDANPDHSEPRDAYRSGSDDDWPALDATTTIEPSMPAPGLLRAATNNDGDAPRVSADDSGALEDDAAITLLPPVPKSKPSTADGKVAAVADADDLPDFVTREQRRRDTQRLVRPLLIVCSIALALALLGQALYAGRTALAANFPQVRPLLDAACLQLGCSVGLPMQIESVSIESSDFQPVVGSRDQFQLNVLLRNRSGTVQAWPAIELSLTDTTDKLIGRKVIMPREYLPAGQTAIRGFSAGSEQAIRLTFELSRMKASGYRVYVFYP